MLNVFVDLIPSWCPCPLVLWVSLTLESSVVSSSTLLFLDTLSMGKSTHSYSLTMTSVDSPDSSFPGTIYWHRPVWVRGGGRGLCNKYLGES